MIDNGPQNRRVASRPQDLFSPGRREAIADDKCSGCGCPALQFRAELHILEYTISGLCQVCQDDVFGTGDE
jgi:hypothetical protein